MSDPEGGLEWPECKIHGTSMRTCDACESEKDSVQPMSSPDVERDAISGIREIVNMYPAISIHRALFACRAFVSAMDGTLGRHDEPEVRESFALLLELVSDTVNDALAGIMHGDGEGRG